MTYEVHGLELTQQEAHMVSNGEMRPIAVMDMVDGWDSFPSDVSGAIEQYLTVVNKVAAKDDNMMENLGSWAWTLWNEVLSDFRWNTNDSIKYRGQEHARHSAEAISEFVGTFTVQALESNVYSASDCVGQWDASEQLSYIARSVNDQTLMVEKLKAAKQLVALIEQGLEQAIEVHEAKLVMDTAVRDSMMVTSLAHPTSTGRLARLQDWKQFDLDTYAQSKVEAIKKAGQYEPKPSEVEDIAPEDIVSTALAKVENEKKERRIRIQDAKKVWVALRDKIATAKAEKEAEKARIKAEKAAQRKAEREAAKQAGN